jgi:hypothetical protein
MGDAVGRAYEATGKADGSQAGECPVSYCPTDEPVANEFHSSISLLLPI